MTRPEGNWRPLRLGRETGKERRDGEVMPLGSAWGNCGEKNNRKERKGKKPKPNTN